MNPLIDNKISDVMKVVGIYSMDIYIIGSLIQPLIKMLFGTGSGFEYWIYVIGSTFIVIVTYILISKYIIRKVKWLRLLLLGLD